MKKFSKKAVAMCAVVVIIGITVLTLGLVSVKQSKYFFEDFKYVQVYNLGQASAFASIEDKIKPELASVNFSVLRAILEGQGGYAPKLNKNSDGEPQYLSSETVASMSATSDKFLLHFVYDEIRTIKASGEEFEYNRVFILLPEGNGEIVEVRAIPYVFENIHNDSDGANSSDLYKIADLKIKMRTSNLYVTIQNAIAEF